MLTRAEAVDRLQALEQVKRELEPLRSAERKLREQLVQYLELEDATELAYEELGIVARLQERRRPDGYDLPRLPDDVVARLAKIPGLLTVNSAALKALGDTSMDLHELRQVRMPGGVTTALVVSWEGQP